MRIDTQSYQFFEIFQLIHILLITKLDIVVYKDLY
jgi:hypothetical protein